MYRVQLPISKSIANRILLLQAIHGDPLMRVSSDMPDDVIVLHNALQQIRDTYGTPEIYLSSPSKEKSELTLSLKNCGTALRFLQVHLQKCYPGALITLTGDPRLMERDGKPTTQTTSARILHGESVHVAPDESPYIAMSRRMAEMYQGPKRNQRLCNLVAERDWSAAAFWYEYIAIHGGELLLEGLKEDSLQGDRIVADIYAKYFGVQTTFTPEGAVIKKSQITKTKLIAPLRQRNHKNEVNRALAAEKSQIAIDFVNCIDLYPPVALTCERLGITLNAVGTERLRYKESHRIEAVRLHEVRNDHRMAMALMAADFPVSIEEQQCIAKSYPRFAEFFKSITRQSRQSTDAQPTVKDYVLPTQFSHITPIKGVNDDNLGKKHALSKLIHAATTEYVWLHDDDVIWPAAANNPSPIPSDCAFGPRIANHHADLIILPLRMESLANRPSLLERLQILEYAAIQELTMASASKGKAVMCSGANLIVRRQAWLECEAELHTEIPSGDDMFLLEAAKRRGLRITAIDEPDYTAIVRPVPAWRTFWRQRMRWAGKAHKYTDRDIIRCGAIIAAANIAQVLCPLIILIKFPIEYSLIRRRQMRELSPIFNSQLLTALLLEIVFPFYMFICLVGGLLRGKRW